MSKYEFQARLARIEANKSGHQVTAGPVQARQDDRKRSRVEKVELAIAIAEQRGIGRGSSYPPAFRLLAALGVRLRPIPYASWGGVFVLGFALGMFIFGGILYSGIGSWIERGPVAGLYRAGWTGVWIVSCGMGIAMATFVKMQARVKGLPRWEDL